MAALDVGPRRRHHERSLGLDLLEGRQLLAGGPTGATLTAEDEVVEVAPAPDAAPASEAAPDPTGAVAPFMPGPTTDDPGGLDDGPAPTGTSQATRGTAVASIPTAYGVANDAFLSRVLYEVPRRMATQVAASGAVGVNTTWEAGQATSWYIEQQRYGADFVQAGLVTGDADLRRQGWQVLDWGFAREAADGSFPGTGDAFHSTSMFVEAAARSLLLEVQSGSRDAGQLVARYLPRIEASARWLMSPDVAARGDAHNAPYTHRRWLLAAALGQVAALTGDAATASAAAGYARRGLALQAVDGMNPEKGGGDSSYQAYGILLAERYLTTCRDGAVAARVRSMIARGLQWERGFIDGTGQVSIAGSTRTGTETARDDGPKTIDYKTIIQAFSVATTLTGDASYRAVARQVAQGRGWDVD